MQEQIFDLTESMWDTHTVNKSSVVLTLITAQKQCLDKWHFNT
jgi:hypothetical protein